MTKSKIIPLARGLIPGESEPIIGQLEISLHNSKKIKISINRKPYTGRSNIKFSIPSSYLQTFIDILEDAQAKLDETWLSRAAIAEFKGVRSMRARG